MWWHVWSSHPTSTSICGCGDTSFYTWVLEWPAYALSHGLNPLYSTAMGYPHGINLLANTGVLAIGVPLSPITWAFGPIATLNVALTLSSALSGLAMFVLLRRWVSWDPAAFVGGLFYGFSPFLLTSLDYSHLQITMLAVPPLIVASLDELLIRQRRRPMATGVLLGVLVALQFFLGSEILVNTMIGVTVGLAWVLVYAVLRRPQVLRDHARFAAVGLSAGVITATVLLAYPTWFALAGPAHLSGSIWPLPLDQYVSHLQRYVISPPSYVYHGYGFNGYVLSSQYLGIGLVLVLLAGLVAWRRDLRLWLFALTGITSLAVAVGTINFLIGNLPLLENLLPTRFDANVFLCAAIMLGIVVDHTHASVNHWYTRRSSGALHRQSRPVAHSVQRNGSHSVDRARKSRGWAGALSGLIVAGIALVPIGTYLFANVPIPVQPLAVPSWFRTVAPHLGKREVLLVFPDQGSLESPMTWQSIDGMHYSMVDEGGPGGYVTRAGAEAPGLTVIEDASLPPSLSTSSGKAAASITPLKIAALRSALHEWGVTMVVIPDQSSLPSNELLPSVTVAAALVTAATGQRPVFQEGAWVWSAVNRARPSIVTTSSKFSQCTHAGTRGVATVDAALACITSKTPFLRVVTSVDGDAGILRRLFVTTVATTVPVTRVDFQIAGGGITGSLTVPAHPFVYGPLAGWQAPSDTTSLPNGTYALSSIAYDSEGIIGRSPDVMLRVAHP